jgi:hypothetical protein
MHGDVFSVVSPRICNCSSGTSARITSEGRKVGQISTNCTSIYGYTTGFIQLRAEVFMAELYLFGKNSRVTDEYDLETSEPMVVRMYNHRRSLSPQRGAPSLCLKPWTAERTVLKVAIAASSTTHPSAQRERLGQCYSVRRA